MESIFKNRQNDTWGNQKNFHRYICNKTLNKKNIGALLDGPGDLVTAGTKKAGVLSLFFVPVFSCKVSQASVISKKFKDENQQWTKIESEINAECLAPVSP